ncbi:MAG: nitroreductase family protein [Anaerolineales bacterium]|nr:nitroreductase family protein [Anaerolineales bacterium]MCZ2120930.1 nitroreductase family protein [Anaerolineales bacterium]
MTLTTDLHAFLRTRRSIRRFKPDPVPDSVLRDILHTATFAPSAHHRQPWRLVALTKSEAKKRLAQSMAAEFERDLQKDGLAQEIVTRRVQKSKERINSAPIVVILCLDMSEMDNYPDAQRQRAEHLIATQSVANAGLQLLLAAHAEGLGGVWVCSPIFAQAIVQTALNLEKNWEPQAMLLIGYPLEIPEVRPRKPIEEVVKIL